MKLDQKRVARRSNLVVRRLPAAARVLSRVHAQLYLLSGGRLLSHWFAGAPVMVLETVGRRSGKRRHNPVLYLRTDGALVVHAANAGADRPPGWWLNLSASGEGVTIIGRTRCRMRPRVLEGTERERRWREFVLLYPAAAEYPGLTERRMPLVALEEIR